MCRSIAALSVAIGIAGLAIPSIVEASQAESTTNACAVLTSADIAKATGLMVANGTAGSAIPGVLGRCTWIGSGDTRVILTLTDAAHMQTTIVVQE
jgi:hypothetical protein